MNRKCYVDELINYLDAVLNREATLLALSKIVKYKEVVDGQFPNYDAYKEHVNTTILNAKDDLNVLELEKAKLTRALQQACSKAAEAFINMTGNGYALNKVGNDILEEVNSYTPRILHMKDLLERNENKLQQISQDKILRLFFETKIALSELYSVGILHPKYQDMTAVSSIYDYFDTGRTYSLTRSGNDPGAYNLYEDDIKANRIITAIDIGTRKISSQLNDIKKNQYSLYNAIQTSNSILAGISNELGIIANKVDLNTQTINRSNEILKASSSFEQQTSQNTRILELVHKDNWGQLRNYDGDTVS